MPGLHVALLELARGAGIDLELGRAVRWLSPRGHLDEEVASAAPTRVLVALAEIHQTLQGDGEALRAKRLGARPTPDLVHVPTGCVVEVDEVQHFTSAREVALGRYPADASLGFSKDEYLDLIRLHRGRAGRAYSHRTSADFPQPGGRQAQRAYNDSLRDLLAPTFTGHPVIRIPVPDRSTAGVLERLKAAIERLDPVPG